MARKRLIAVLSASAIFLMACAADDQEEKGSGERPPQEVNGQSNETSAVEFTPDEKERYTLFAKDLKIEHLKGLEPISVAKMYVQAALSQEYDVQYALYTDRAEAVQWTVEEDRKIPDSDRGTYEQNQKIYNNIGAGTFIQTSDHEGYVEYDSGEGMSGLQMIQNEDGTWQVAFMPVQ